jgi:uncharacterized protein YjdB
MKWKNQRTKTLALISGALIVVIAALVVFTQTSGTELSGASQVQIAPFQSTILVGQKVTLTMNGATNCTWSSPQNNISFVDGVVKESTVTVKGMAGGTANIKASCSGKTGVGTVTVWYPTPTPTKLPLSIKPLNPRIRPNGTYQTSVLFTAVNASGECQWSTSPSNVGWALINGGYEIHFDSNRLGTFTVTAKCGGETASSILTVTLDNQ